MQGILYMEEIEKVLMDNQLDKRPLKMVYAEGELEI